MTKKRKSKIIEIDSDSNPYDLSINIKVLSKTKKRKSKIIEIDSDSNPYDLSEIDMEQRREFFARNRYRL